MTIYRENLQYTQELQQQYYDKHAKPRNYAPGNKVWVNSKYIKIKQNCKLEAKFFRPFKVLYRVGKEAYKLELLKKWRIQNVFYILLLEKNTTKKGRINQTTSQIELDKGDNKKYKIKVICNSKVYTKELDNSYHLPGLYYLVS